MGLTVLREKITSPMNFVNSLIADFTTPVNGFQPFSVIETHIDSSPDPQFAEFMIESKDVDTLSSTHTYRLAFTLTKEAIPTTWPPEDWDVNLYKPYIMPDQSIVPQSSQSNWRLRVWVGAPNQLPTIAGIHKYVVDPEVENDPQTPRFDIWFWGEHPSQEWAHHYRATFTNRGFAISCWKSIDLDMVYRDRSNYIDRNFMLCIQRPVDPVSGLPVVTGNAPLFALCLDAMKGERLYQFVVRELDRAASTPPQDISRTPPVPQAPAWGELFENPANPMPTNAPGLYSVILQHPFPNLNSSFNHIIRFPFGLSTSRHVYMHEMDLIGIVSASSFQTHQMTNITMYSENSARTYTSTIGNAIYDYYLLGDFWNFESYVKCITAGIPPKDPWNEPSPFDLTYKAPKIRSSTFAGSRIVILTNGPGI